MHACVKESTAWLLHTLQRCALNILLTQSKISCDLLFTMYQLYDELRKRLADVEVSNTLVYLFEMHSHVTFDTLFLHFISLEMDWQLYYITMVPP